MVFFQKTNIIDFYLNTYNDTHKRFLQANNILIKNP